MRDTHKTEVDYDKGTLVVTRTFNAGIEDVFDAWIQTSKVKEWWGCAQTVQVESEIEPRVGGSYTHKATLDNGYHMSGENKFFIYDPPHTLGYEMMDEERGVKVQVTVAFTSKNKQTHVQLTHQNIRDEFSEYIIGGWSAAFEKLSKFLTKAPQAHHATPTQISA